MRERYWTKHARDKALSNNRSAQKPANSIATCAVNRTITGHMASTATLDHRAQHDVSDGASDGHDVDREAVHQLAIRNQIRAKCRDDLLACAVDPGTAMNEKDVETYMEQLFGERGLENAKDEREKTQWLRENMNTQVPLFIKQATAAGNEVMNALRQARKEKAISLENFAEWMGRLKDGSWLKTQEFIEKKMTTYANNWMEIAKKRRELLKDPRVEMLKESGILKKDELDDFLSGVKFLNVHYKRRVHLVDLVKAALSRTKEGQGMEAMKKTARTQLDDAVEQGFLAKNKVGTWMKRIFDSDWSPVTIQNFLSGKSVDGILSLTHLKNNWREIKERFDGLDDRRKKEGTPRSFHFVKNEVFLNMGYPEQKSYVREAEHRFDDIEKAPDLFKKIRHELDTKDWDAADELIAEADGGNWSEEDAEKLDSMKSYLKEHRPKAPAKQEGKKQEQGPQEILDDIREAVQLVPVDHMRERYQITMEDYDYQTLWALCTEIYNEKWCQIHGYASREQNFETMQYVKDNTYSAMENGISRGHVALDATTDTSVTAFREENDTRSAQAIFVDSTTDNRALVEKIHRNKDNWSVWYWTRIVEKDVPFEVIDYLITNVQPRLKRGMRKLEAMGYRYTRSGPARKKDGSVQYAKAEAKDEGAHYATMAL